MVALDNSSSMNTTDFPTDMGTRLISRLQAAKNTFLGFVEGRRDDLIGLVVFANYPEFACPPILDHGVSCGKPLPLCDRRVLATMARTSATRLRGGSMHFWRLRPNGKSSCCLTDGNNEPAVPKPLDPNKRPNWHAIWE